MKKLIIYYANGSTQVVKPMIDSKNRDTNFNGDWHSLVLAITLGNYVKYDIL